MSIEDEIYANLPVGGWLASQRFFEPNGKFFSAMRFYRGKKLYDVGAGMGHVTEALTADKHKVVGLDIGVRENQSPLVVTANATIWKFEKGSVMLLCRPCHGSFVSVMIRRALVYEMASVIYVGLPRNMEPDLGDFAALFGMRHRSVGSDGERMYVYDLSVSLPRIKR